MDVFLNSFIYCASDADGFPGLLVDEPITAQSIVALRPIALATDFVRGVLTRESNSQICFQIHKGKSDSVLRLRQHLDGILQDQVPAVQGGEDHRIMGVEGFFATIVPLKLVREVQSFTGGPNVPFSNRRRSWISLE